MGEVGTAGATVVKWGEEEFPLLEQIDDNVGDLKGTDRRVVLRPSAGPVKCAEWQSLAEADFRGISLGQVADRAFECCRWLVRVLLPGVVTELGDYCFDGCVRLRAIEGIGRPLRVGKVCFALTLALRMLSWDNRIRSLGEQALFVAGLEKLRMSLVTSQLIELSACGFVRIFAVPFDWKGRVALPESVTPVDFSFGRAELMVARSLDQAIPRFWGVASGVDDRKRTVFELSHVRGEVAQLCARLGVPALPG